MAFIGVTMQGTARAELVPNGAIHISVGNGWVSVTPEEAAELARQIAVALESAQEAAQEVA